MRKKLFLVIAIFNLIVSASAHANDQLNAVYQQWLVVSETAAVYDACAGQNLIQHSGPTAADQVKKWIAVTPISLNAFSEGTTDAEVRDAMRLSLTKAQNAFISRNPSLSTALCARANFAWQDDAKQYGG